MMTRDEIIKALDARNVAAERMRGLVTTLRGRLDAIGEPYSLHRWTIDVPVPELLALVDEKLSSETDRRTREHLAAEAAPDVIEMALKSYFGEVCIVWPPTGSGEMHEISVQKQQAMMSAALTAVGIKLAADAERLMEAGMSNDAIGRIREELYRDPAIPVAAFVDDHVRNAVILLWQARSRADAAEKALAEAVAALENSNSLFAAMLHEDRPRDEIEEQCHNNRILLAAIRARSSGASS